MEAVLRERIVHALEPASPRAAAIVARADRCWGDIARTLEQTDLTLRERARMRDALVGVGDRNALLLFASLYGPEFLATRQRLLPADLQVWLVAEGFYDEGLSPAAERLAEDGSPKDLLREREIFRAAIGALRSHLFPAAAS